MSELKKQTIFIILTVLAIVLTCVVGYKLRHQNYSTVPFPGESRDEYSFTWLGLSLLEDGQPIATSGLSPYQHDWQYINVDNIFQNFANPNPFPIDTPWFDHPPLFSLIPGAYSELKGVQNFADASVAVSRLPMVLLGVVSIFLVFLLALLIKGKRVALASAAIYAVAPVIVISSRTVQAENFLIVTFLSSLISYYLYFKTKNGNFFWLAIGLSGLSTLVKISGWSVCLSLLAISATLEEKQKLRRTIIIFLGTLFIFLLFPLYGFFYNWSLFKEVWFTNSSRFFRDGFSAVYMLIFKPNVMRYLLDGWITLGWIAVAMLGSQLKADKRIIWIIAPFVSYLLVYLILGSEGYGWYKYPFFPFLAIALGWKIIESIDNFNPVFSLLLIFIPGGIMLYRIIPPETLQNYMMPYRIAILAIFAFLGLMYFQSANKRLTSFFQYSFYIMFAILIGVSIYTNQLITPQSWYNENWLSFL